MLGFLVGAVVVACQPVKEAAPPPPPPPPPPPAPAVPTPAVDNDGYPDFPDPFVLKDVAPGYLAASTNNGDLIRMPTVSSVDLASWAKTDELLSPEPQNKPNCVSDQPGFWWAPAVWRQSDTSFFLYFTAPHNDGRQCIGGATASAPEGPYLVTGVFLNNPVVCQSNTGSIDPSVFVASNGQAWLLWKRDGNCCGLQPYIYARRLGPDGRLTGPSPANLIGVTQTWEFGTGPHNTAVEGPTMIEAGGSYYLFYSGSDWKSTRYATGYAKCSSIATGACVKPQNGPVLASGSNGRGPGGGEVFRAHNGQRWLAYHAWNPSKPIGSSGERRLHLSALGFAGGVPFFGGGP